MNMNTGYQPDFSNPHSCMSDAYCFAIVTAQWDFCNAYEGSIDEFDMLADGLIADGILPPLNGDVFGSVNYEAIIRNTAAKNPDARLTRLVEITNLRFMVELDAPENRTLN